MPTATIAGQDVQINDEGFLTEYDEWNEAIGTELTKQQFQLFPKKPGRKMSYVAGLPKPHGCV